MTARRGCNLSGFFLHRWATCLHVVPASQRTSRAFGSFPYSFRLALTLKLLCEEHSFCPPFLLCTLMAAGIQSVALLVSWCTFPLLIFLFKLAYFVKISFNSQFAFIYATDVFFQQRPLFSFLQLPSPTPPPTLLLSFKLLFSSCLLFSPSVICRAQLLSFPQRKEKSPLQIIGAAWNDFNLLIYCPTSSSASLRRQRASKVLRYCHLQFLFYLRFFILQYHVGWTDPLCPLCSYNVSTFFSSHFPIFFIVYSSFFLKIFFFFKINSYTWCDASTTVGAALLTKLLLAL